jgi:hypothetical protein
MREGRTKRELGFGQMATIGEKCLIPENFSLLTDSGYNLPLNLTLHPEPISSWNEVCFALSARAVGNQTVRGTTNDAGELAFWNLG